MRREFSKTIKREALRRSHGLCEASGGLYGLSAGKYCGAPLANGVEFDHVLADSNGGEPTLENCLAVCLRCHTWKTRHVDTPRAAKIKRQSDKTTGIRKRSSFQNSRTGKYRTKMTGKTELR